MSNTSKAYMSEPGCELPRFSGYGARVTAKRAQAEAARILADVEPGRRYGVGLDVVLFGEEEPAPCVPLSALKAGLARRLAAFVADGAAQ